MNNTMQSRHGDMTEVLMHTLVHEDSSPVVIPYLSWTDATALLCAALREYAYYIPKRKEKNEIKKGAIAAR